MLRAIRTEIVCGAVIGFAASHWLDRIVFVWIVGLVACVELFFLRNNPLALFFRSAMRREGLSRDEIAEMWGAGGSKGYLKQFIFSTVIALPFSLLGGFVRVVFFI